MSAAESVLPSRAVVQNPNIVLALLSLVGFVAYLHRTLWSVLAISVKADLGLSDTQVGMLGGFAFAMCYALMGIPLARLADRGNRIGILSVCAAVWAFATIACGMAQSLVLLFVARLGLGLGEAGCLPSSHSILSDCFPPERRTFAFGMLEAGGALGAMAGIVFAGLISSHYGWRMAFYAMGAPGLLVALILYFYVREPERGRFESKDTVLQGSGQVWELLRRPTYLRVLVVVTLCVMGYYGILQWLPSFFSRSHRMSMSDIGVYLGFAFGVGSIIGSATGAIFCPRLIKLDRRWELRIPAITFGCSAPVYLAVFNVPSQWAALTLVTVGSFVMSVGFAPSLAAVQSVSDRSVRATAVAIAMFVSALFGQGLGPMLVGALSDAIKVQYLDDSLRIALSFYTGVLVLSGVYAWRASLTMMRDLRS